MVDIARAMAPPVCIASCKVCVSVRECARAWRCLAAGWLAGRLAVRSSSMSPFGLLVLSSLLVRPADRLVFRRVGPFLCRRLCARRLVYKGALCVDRRAVLSVRCLLVAVFCLVYGLTLARVSLFWSRATARRNDKGDGLTSCLTPCALLEWSWKWSNDCAGDGRQSNARMKRRVDGRSQHVWIRAIEGHRPDVNQKRIRHKETHARCKCDETQTGPSLTTTTMTHYGRGGTTKTHLVRADDYRKNRATEQSSIESIWQPNISITASLPLF